MLFGKRKRAAPRVGKINRWRVGSNVVAQSVLWVILIVMINYLGFRHFRRWDVSREQRYSLSPQTLKILKHLKKPIKAVMFFSNGTEIAPDVTALLREYGYCSNGQFSYEVIDPFRNLTRAQELQAKYKFGAKENILILDSGNRSKFINAAEMAEFEQPDQLAVMAGQSEQKLKIFKGEQAVTSALLELTEGLPSKVYYVSGHGEPDCSGQELKIFRESLMRQNIEIGTWNLLGSNEIPLDAKALVICGPKYDFSEREINLLAQFWDAKGRLFILLNPYVRSERLVAWLNSLGVTPQNDQVIKLGTFLGVDANGKPQLRSDVIREATFVVSESDTNITRELVGVTKQMLGVTESLSLAVESSPDTITKIAPLLVSAEGFWGDVADENAERPAAFDPKRDHIGPLCLAASVEKGGVVDQRVKLDTSRLVVVGNAEVLSNNAYRKSEGVSIDLTVNALNWLLSREQVMGIAPKDKRRVPFNLDERQMARLAIGVMFIIPGFVGLLGAFVWWRRRA